MRAVRLIVVGVVAAAGMVSVGAAAPRDAMRLAAVMRHCDQLDRGAADLARNIERSQDFERERDNLLIADLTAFRAYARIGP